MPSCLPVLPSCQSSDATRTPTASEASAPSLLDLTELDRICEEEEEEPWATSSCKGSEECDDAKAKFDRILAMAPWRRKKATSVQADSEPVASAQENRASTPREGQADPDVPVEPRTPSKWSTQTLDSEEATPTSTRKPRRKVKPRDAAQKLQAGPEPRLCQAGKTKRKAKVTMADLGLLDEACAHPQLHASLQPAVVHATPMPAMQRMPVPAASMLSTVPAPAVMADGRHIFVGHFEPRVMPISTAMAWSPHGGMNDGQRSLQGLAVCQAAVPPAIQAWIDHGVQQSMEELTAVLQASAPEVYED